MKFSTIMKKAGKFFSIFLLFYLSVCIMLSFYVSFEVMRWKIIEERGPFFLLSVDRSSIVGKQPYDRYWGYNQHGEIIWFLQETEERETLEQGKKAVSLFFYTPYSGIDNVAARWDFVEK